MQRLASQILLPPKDLSPYVECIRIANYSGNEELSIKACPNGTPGMLFQSSQGRSAIRSIATSSGRATTVPILFLYGQITELSVMDFACPFTTIQVVLWPSAIKTLFNMDASGLRNSSVPLTVFSRQLERQLLATDDDQIRINLITSFLMERLTGAGPQDTLVEKCLHTIHANVGSITAGELPKQFHISERQLQKRFIQHVGISPQLYIRIKRFNEALRLMDSGAYETLGDIAHALNFHDHSHFFHDVKLFSGVTPTSISQKVNDFRHDQGGSSYF